MQRRCCVLLLMLALALLLPNTAWASGGPIVMVLTDVARQRFQAISFFLLGVLASAWVVRVTWNFLKGDFPRLPRLSYLRALSIMVLWGLMCLLVLTMIPGVYQLTNEPKRPSFDEVARANHERLLVERCAGLAQLGTTLLLHAARSEGQFPSQAGFDALDDELKALPELTGVHYLYVPGHAEDESAQILAFEPNVYGDESLVLMTDGLIQAMTTEELRNALTEAAVP